MTRYAAFMLALIVATAALHVAMLAFYYDLLSMALSLIALFILALKWRPGWGPSAPADTKPTAQPTHQEDPR